MDKGCPGSYVSSSVSLAGVACADPSMAVVEAAASVAAPCRSMLDPTQLREMVREWLREDIPAMDFAGAVVGSDVRTAHLLQKSPGMLAGVPFVEAVFDELGMRVEWDPHVHEGMRVEHTGAGEKRVLASVTGPADDLLRAERVALNCLSRCSGIATRADDLMRIAAAHGWRGRVAATRKTTPGFRVVEKYGVIVGGADPHRMNLSSMIMLKDNHVWSAGNITKSVQRARALAGFSVKIEVECRSLDEAREACHAGADVVMLDNFDPLNFKETARAVRSEFAHVIIEGSGGLSESTLSDFFCEEADVLSMSIMQNYQCVDFSLKIQRPSAVG
ncbi:Nicotinate-nucleotide pyrophosphorylase, carboxylating [Porphyridium purpureum]|uniref:Nicotinate-nucleotide pyrophosphorylase [carboxylating] n=1 Tax=Porphyridium purpureum TaxID=35688 RepID=A0A5J4YYL6_PORPP|nr:Nicotinate-nucleotide pyrophosphorylase, carboxylating [Porphyridium purpureum]|eukprot:POR4903..scf209_3